MNAKGLWAQVARDQHHLVKADTMLCINHTRRSEEVKDGRRPVRYLTWVAVQIRHVIGRLESTPGHYLTMYYQPLKSSRVGGVTASFGTLRDCHKMLDI